MGMDNGGGIDCGIGGWAGWRGQKGKNWDNWNRINTKIFQKGPLISPTGKQTPAVCISVIGPLAAQRCSGQEFRHLELHFLSPGYQRLSDRLSSHLHLCP